MAFYSRLPGISWPAILPSQGSNLLALLYQFEETQWWPPELLRAHQFHQLVGLVHHARKTAPYYRQMLANLGNITDGDQLKAHWSDLPVTTRHDVQRAGDTLFSAVPPVEHGKTYEIKTSGSTGSPVRVLGSTLTQSFWQAITLREHLWHQRDFTGKLAVIRRAQNGVALPPDGEHQQSWGPPVNLVFHSGPSAMLSLVSSSEQQVQWLAKERADYLLTFPTLLQGLLTYCVQTGLQLHGFKQIRTIGEVVTPALRAQCQAVLGAPLVDTYSNQEAGYLALQCPDHDHYHVQAESVLVEILDEQNRACAIGDTGRVVITALHNFVTPLIRYETGDYAELGEACACGRGLPVMRRIMGRARNMLIYPAGERRFPLLGGEHYADYAPVRQYRMIQRRVDLLEVQLLVHRTPSAAQMASLHDFIASRMGSEFEIMLTIVDNLPRTPGGKFEDFVTDLDVAGVTA